MLRPVGKTILVKILPKEKATAILIVPDSKDEPFTAVVVGIGAKVELEIKVGETVLLLPYTGSPINKKDTEHLLVGERDIIGVVE